jgi:uncharacterized membrane protein YgcG
MHSIACNRYSLRQLKVHHQQQGFVAVVQALQGCQRGEPAHVPVLLAVQPMRDSSGSGSGSGGSGSRSSGSGSGSGSGGIEKV